MHTQPLLTPHALKREFPTTEAQQNFVNQSRAQVKNILDGTDPRILLIVGPCSIHDLSAAREYALKLSQLSKSVSDTFLLVMRCYMEKPRTALGWKGMLYDPHLDGSNDINTGLRWSRELLMTLANLQVPVGTEFLDPLAAAYLEDLISWGCIGARTTSSQTHRQIASGLEIPIAFKNNTDGNYEVAIGGILSAAHPQTYIGINNDGQAAILHTKGNSDCHIALRGGESKTNYDPESIEEVLKRLAHFSLPSRLIIDCSHDNSRRKHQQQSVVFQSVIGQIVEGHANIRGLILESHLFEGNQSFTTDRSQLQYAVSLTDPCLDWETTEKLIRWAQTKLNSKEAINIQ
jgi:3-deoxy-7-phosphoheptulonate synthase